MVVNFSKKTIQFSRGPSSSRNRGDAASVAWDVVGGQRERRTADRDLAEFGATNSIEFRGLPKLNLRGYGTLWTRDVSEKNNGSFYIIFGSFEMGLPPLFQPHSLPLK